MYKVIESDLKGVEAFEYVADTKDVHTCNHHFVKRNSKVECTNCGVGYIDNEDEPFPIDELNKFFENKKNQKYFENNIP